MKYTILAHLVNILHNILIYTNLAAIPALVILEPWYIWVPLITFLVSPLLGGAYCIFNNLEDHYRLQAGLSPKQREY